MTSQSRILSSPVLWHHQQEPHAAKKLLSREFEPHFPVVIRAVRTCERSRIKINAKNSEFRFVRLLRRVRQWRRVGSKFGEAKMWRGIVSHVYIEYRDSNYYLYSNITRRSFSLQINQLIHQALWVESVCSLMRILFSIETQANAESRSWVMEFLKKVFTRFKQEKLLSKEALCK